VPLSPVAASLSSTGCWTPNTPASSTRDLTPSFLNVRARWLSTVFMLMYSEAAIDPLVLPSAASRATRRSAGVNESKPRVWSRLGRAPVACSSSVATSINDEAPIRTAMSAASRRIILADAVSPASR